MSDRKPSNPLPTIQPAFLAPEVVDNFLEAMQHDRAVERGYANVTYDRLMEEIRTFEATLAKDEEIGAYLASFGTQQLIRVADIGFANPYLITFYGTTVPGGNRAQLCQHVSQLNVLLTALKVAVPEVPARRIGFVKHDATGER